MRARFWPAVLSAALALGVCCSASAAPKQYPYRFVYVHGKPLENMEQVELIRNLAKTAGEHGLNGLILDAFFDCLPLEPPYNFKNLKEIVRACEENGIEFIPAFMGMGYNAPLQVWDKNLIEGLPVRDALFVVDGDEARLVADPPVGVENGGFERFDGDIPAGFTPEPGAEGRTSRDSGVKKSGGSSLRVECSGGFEEESAVLTQEITVSPGRCYMVSCWVKTQSMEGQGDVFPMLVRGPDGRRLQYYIPPLKPDSDWTLARIGFNSLGYDKVRISVGAPSDDDGVFWIDDLAIREAGLVNVLRRQGTPLVVRGEQSGVVYEEGHDFEQVRDPLMNLLFDHDGPPIRIKQGGRIAPGEHLRVSFYNNYPIYAGQTPVCISEPRVYEIWDRVARMLHEYIHPDKYYLGVDELRVCGSCELCRSRGMTPSELLGDCVNRQVEIIRRYNPDAEIFIWSDMFDPNHNAPGRYEDYYYHVDQTFQRTWELIPKDLVIVCWWHQMRDKSLEHFSSHGFRTLGSSSGSLDVARDWLHSLDNTPNSVGIMYTTWSDNFEVLPDFADLVNRKIE